MTLGIVASRFSEVDAEMFHAISPAVPKSATARVKQYAAKENWNLTIAGVGEFEDKRYRENPVNRCFYCKENLYKFMSDFADDKQVISGANLDDITDYRPGLKAASKFSVRHPYVESGVTKAEIRQIAKLVGAYDLSELPASPCLSSRVETGIKIESEVLLGIDRVESFIRKRLAPAVVRCRVRKGRITIELDKTTYDQLLPTLKIEIKSHVRTYLTESQRILPIHFSEYRMGSAFVGAKL